MARKEVQRTCTRDGAVWYVPVEVAKYRKPPKGKIRALKMQEWGEQVGGFGTSGAGIQLSRIEAEAARVEAASRCPTCGSQAFTEKVVKI